jgi:sugar/nucleoside kinase (ribokinase family)
MPTKGSVRVLPPNTPVAIGMGLVALDVILTDNKDQQPRYFAGGTCGNVLTILRYLGWRSNPIARLSPGAAADRVLDDLKAQGVSTDFMTRRRDGSTPVIIHRIRRGHNGEPYHTFSWRCPSCGAHLPGYKAVLSSVARDLSPTLGRAQVFFFDRVSRAVLVLANELRKHGAVIVFEPSSVGDPKLFREAWTAAHIVKYSHERLRDIADVEFARGERDHVLLEVETLGRAGVRYQSRLPRAATRGWVPMEAFLPMGLKDTAGAGDWCTAGLIDKLARGGLLGCRKITGGELKDSLRFGQALAAWNCRFEGARGGMYEGTKTEFDREIAHILKGATLDARLAPLDDRDVPQAVRRLCPSCNGLGSARRPGVQDRRRA